MVESIKACVTRGDFVGSAAADTMEGLAPLRAFAERHGVDVAADPEGVMAAAAGAGAAAGAIAGNLPFFRTIFFPLSIFAARC